MENTASFGYWLQRQRNALDLTPQGLADRVGCSLAAIKKFEDDERRPSRRIAGRMAEVSLETIEVIETNEAIHLRFRVIQ